LQADFERLSVVSLLAPSAIAGEPSQQAKMDFFSGLQSHLQKISHKRRDYIFCSNLNIAHEARDVEQAENKSSTSGFLTEERQWLDQLYCEINYADAFRLSNDDNDEFSWWPSGELSEGDGWRTDTQIISKSLSGQVEYAVLYTAKAFSSHAPVIIDYDIHDL